jgi:transposase
VRTSAIITLKALIVNVDPELREELQGLPKMALIDRCAGLRPGHVGTPLAASKHAHRMRFDRWPAGGVTSMRRAGLMRRCSSG